MRVVRNVIDLEIGKTREIILRNITEPFWQKCIDVVNTPNERIRVAAVGTPGIGKTSSTPWLIRMLLKQSKTVVYLLRTVEKTGWYYEYIPNSDGTVIATNIYPERLDIDLIPSLRLRSSYYIVDPGQTENTCDPPTNFDAKVILVPSPDSGHWGGSKFEKRRGDVLGKLLYFPTWSQEELLSARPILGPDLTDDQVRDRYFQFGGVPRHIFESEKNIKALLKTQNRAVKAISSEIAKYIVLGQEDAFDAFGQATKSAVLAFRLSAEDNGTFEEGESYIVSELVSEKIFSRFQSSLWNAMLDLGTTGGGAAILGMITRHMIASGKPPSKFECRKCVGVKDKDYETEF